MATQEKTWNVANRLHSQKDSDNPEVNHIIAGADEIYDDAKGAKQSDINAQTGAALANRYTKAETYSKEQLDSLITTPNVEYVTVATFADLPQTGESDTVYRVSSYDGTQVDITKYALYAWDGTTYQLLAVRSAIGEVVDVSEINSGATYADLSAALAAVPESVKRGGMSIKFIQRTNTGTQDVPVYNDEYVQYRYMGTSIATADFTNTANWQGIDDEPTPGSRKLVESGGIAKTFASLGMTSNNIINKYIAEIYIHDSSVTLTQVDFAIASYVSTGQYAGKYLNMIRLRTSAGNKTIYSEYCDSEAIALSNFRQVASKKVIAISNNNDYMVCLSNRDIETTSLVSGTPTFDTYSDLQSLPNIKNYFQDNDIVNKTGQNLTLNSIINGYIKELVYSNQNQSTAYVKVYIYIGYGASSVYYNTIAVDEFNSTDTRILRTELVKNSYNTLEEALANIPTGVISGDWGEILLSDKYPFNDSFIAGDKVLHSLTYDYAPILRGIKVEEEIRGAMSILGEGITKNTIFNTYVKELVYAFRSSSAVSVTLHLRIGYITSNDKFGNALRIDEHDINGERIKATYVFKVEEYNTVEEALANIPSGIVTTPYCTALLSDSIKEAVTLTSLVPNYPLTYDYAPSLRSLQNEESIEEKTTSITKAVYDGEIKSGNVTFPTDNYYVNVWDISLVEGLRYKVHIEFAEIAPIDFKVSVRHQQTGSTTNVVTYTMPAGESVAEFEFVAPISYNNYYIVVNEGSGTGNHINFSYTLTTPYNLKQVSSLGGSTLCKILFIGSSLGQDSVQYTPPILMNMGVSNYVIGYAFKGGCRLNETLAALNGDTTITYDYHKWENGATMWKTINKQALVTEALSDEDWDIIVLSQGADVNYGDYDTYFAPYIGDVCRRIYDIVGHGVRLGWNMLCSGYIDLSDTFENNTQRLQRRYETVVSNAKRVMAENPIEFILAGATAIQNARNTSLNTTGFEGHLVGDTTHLNDGLPRMLIGYYTAIKILDFLCVKKSVLGDKLLFDNKPFLQRYNIQNWHRGIEGETGYDGRTYPYYESVTDDKRYLAQLCAIAAIKEPYTTSIIEV